MNERFQAPQPLGFAPRLRILREQRRITPEALAKLAGLSEADIVLLEADRISPTLHHVQQLAQALQCPAGLLIGHLADYDEVADRIMNASKQLGHIAIALRAIRSGPLDRVDSNP